VLRWWQAALFLEAMERRDGSAHVAIPRIVHDVW